MNWELANPMPDETPLIATCDLAIKMFKKFLRWDLAVGGLNLAIGITNLIRCWASDYDWMWIGCSLISIAGVAVCLLGVRRSIAKLKYWRRMRSSILAMAHSIKEGDMPDVLFHMEQISKQLNR